MQINAMITEAKAAVEEEMQLTIERYKACLARVELERTALEEQLTQKDAEIASILATVEELRSSAETQVICSIYMFINIPLLQLRLFR